MGWERKRGKLHELNRLLRGATDTTFVSVDRRRPRAARRRALCRSRSTRTRGCPRAPPTGWSARWPIRSTARASTPTRTRVVEGYGVLQPRITPTLPTGREARPTSGSSPGRAASTPTRPPSPTSTRISSTKGPTRGRGSTRSTPSRTRSAGRVPENTLLSHDLFEGTFARAGLVTDVELFEEFPSNYEVAAAPPSPLGARGLAAPALDSRSARATKGAVGLPVAGALEDDRQPAPDASCASPRSCSLSRPGPCRAAAAVRLDRSLRGVARRARLHPRARRSVFPRRRGISQAQPPARGSVRTFVAAASQTSWRVTHAPSSRLAHGRCHRAHDRPALRHPAPASRVGARRAGGLRRRSAARRLLPASALAACSSRRERARSWCRDPTGRWLVAAPFVLALGALPRVAWRISLPRRALAARAVAAGDPVRSADRRAAHLAILRGLRRASGRTRSRRTTSRRIPSRSVAHRTSPTNIGLYLLATVAARDFGWIGTPRRRGAARGDVRDPEPARALPRPLLQLVRHGRPPAARTRGTCPPSTAATWPGTCSPWRRRARELVQSPLFGRASPRTGSGTRCTPAGARWTSRLVATRTRTVTDTHCDERRRSDAGRPGATPASLPEWAAPAGPSSSSRPRAEPCRARRARSADDAADASGCRSSPGREAVAGRGRGATRATSRTLVPEYGKTAPRADDPRAADSPSRSSSLARISIVRGRWTSASCSTPRGSCSRSATG